MPLSLEQYAESYLPGRGLPWPVAPKIDPPKAKPHLGRLPVRAVFWTAYGTLLAIPGGELHFEHERDFVTEAALEKTIQEFKMWQSMVRRPGPPGPQMRELFKKAHSTLQLTGGPSGEKYPEVQTEKIWDDIVKKLMQKEYQFDATLYGGLNEYAKKIAYFYHASIQGVGAYPGAADAVKLVAERGVLNGLLADGQCFTPAQIHKAFREQDASFDVNAAFPPALRVISGELRAKKPSDALFKAAVAALAAKGLKPGDALHVGSNLARDIGPAKRHGFRTALFAGDKNSLSATAEQLKDPATKPDVMLTELTQILDVVG